MPKKRVTMKLKSPNPLFIHWLTEWHGKAVENDSRMKYCFSLALKSLKQYPLPLESGRDCKILQGFGNRLCQMIDEKLEAYKRENPDTDLTTVALQLPKTEPTKVAPKPKQTKRKNNNTASTSKSPKLTSPTKEYIPQYRSGAYAILMTLYEAVEQNGSNSVMTKNEIIKSGQHLTDTSFTKPANGTRYTGWSSMKILLEKKLVEKRGNPAKFNVSEQGQVLAEKLFIQYKIDEFQQLDSEQPTTSKLQANPSCTVPKPLTVISNMDSNNIEASAKSTAVPEDTVILMANNFRIILLVDTQETNGATSTSTDPLLQELNQLCVNYEVRNLKVGDYVWICRDNITNTELVLPYIVERKRMDDFGSSIKDGRFHEQKFRLRQSGIQNLIYLVESYGNDSAVGLPITTLHQAAMNTFIQDGFSVKFTADLQDSVRYLCNLSKMIIKYYKDKTVIKCSSEDLKEISLDDELISLIDFIQFNKTTSKTKKLSIKDRFARSLLQISGMSVDKALAIIDKYPTPKKLKLEYEKHQLAEGEKLLALLPYGPLRKKLGPVLSKIVYQLFCNKSF